MSETIKPSGPTESGESLSGDHELAALADEFLRRRRGGEAVSPEEYAAKYPHLGDRIRDVFPAMILMEHDDEPPGERVGPTVGRYKLLERIGEGGFGVV